MNRSYHESELSRIGAACPGPDGPAGAAGPESACVLGAAAVTGAGRASTSSASASLSRLSRSRWRAAPLRPSLSFASRTSSASSSSVWRRICRLVGWLAGWRASCLAGFVHRCPSAAAHLTRSLIDRRNLPAPPQASADLGRSASAADCDTVCTEPVFFLYRVPRCLSAVAVRPCRPPGCKFCTPRRRAHAALCTLSVSQRCR